MPAAFSQLTSLVWVSAAGNELTEVPAFILGTAAISTLEWANLEGNRISSVPGSLSAAVSTATRSSLLLASNPVCSSPPYSVVGSSGGGLLYEGHWQVSCVAQCAVGCISTAWDTPETLYRLEPQLKDGYCDTACNVSACGFDQGDCL